MTVETNVKDDGITLLPCPFCGAEVEVLSDMHRTWGLIKHRDGCLFPNHHYHEIPEYDFAAWNTRHVETDALREACRELVAYAGTCHRVDVNGYSFRFECSACGYVAIVHNCETRLDELTNYCPNCGRKVEG